MNKIGEKSMYVTFNFGSVVYLSINLYEGKTLEECIKLHSEDIDGYIGDDDKYHQI